MIAHCFYAAVAIAVAVADILLESSMFELFSKLDILIIVPVVVVVFVTGKWRMYMIIFSFILFLFCIIIILFAFLKDFYFSYKILIFWGHQH